MAIRVLLVDDDDEVRGVLGRLLTRAGYDVEEVADGGEALAAHARQRPDVVLTDILMPGCDGIELILALRRRDPDATIVAMSGGGTCRDELYLKTATEFGAVVVLPKPISAATLLSGIAEALRQAQQRRALTA